METFPPDPRIDAYIARAAAFARPILETLRERVRRACPEVEETLKWSSPSFVYRGKILCHMAAFKQHAAFGFWQHAQVMGGDADRDGMGSFGRMSTLRDVPSARVLTPLLRKAMALIDDGVSSAGPRKTQARRPALVDPPELVAALKRNAAARATFEGFSASHRREYIEWIAEAKREDTRARRVAQAIEWLAEGKSRNWKYATR